MNDAKPWQIKGVPWKTEASFWSWVRGVLRKGWGRHPVKIEYVKENRIKVPNPNPNGRVSEVWGMTCRQCRGQFAMPIDRKTRKRIEAATGEELITIEINHKTASGSLKGKEDLGNFAAKLLFINFDDLEPLCQTCHRNHSYAEKQGISYEEAVISKKIIQIVKDKSDKDFLLDKGITPENSIAKRKLQLIKYFEENK